VLGTATSREVDQLRPNRGVQGVIAATLVQFQLASDDPALRLAALDAIEDDPEERHLALLEDLVTTETDADVLAGPSFSCPRSSSRFPTTMPRVWRPSAALQAMSA
jgi:hypothetical protein